MCHVQCLRFTQDLLEFSKRFGSLHWLCPLQQTHTDCLRSSGRFHYIAAVVLGSHPIVPCSHNTGPTPIFSPRSSSWCKPYFFFMTTSILGLHLLLWLQLLQWPSCFLTVLHDVSITSRLVLPPGRFLHYQVIFPGQSINLETFGTQLLGADSEETIPRDFTLMMLVSP